MLLELLFHFVVVNNMGYPRHRGPLNHSIYHDLGYGHIHLVNLQVILKPALTACRWHTSTTSNGGFHLEFRGGNARSHFLHNAQWLYAVRWAGCCLRNNLCIYVMHGLLSTVSSEPQPGTNPNVP